MSIAYEISRIQAAKTALQSAINAKGGNLTGTQLLDDYALAVENIPVGADVSQTTVTAADMLAGKTAVAADGTLITGTIETVNAVLEGNTVYVPAGFIAESQTFTVENPGVDTADATVAAETLLAGVTAYGANGKVTGTIETVTAVLTDNTVTVPSGFIAETETLTVPEAPAARVTGNTVSLYKGYYPQDSELTVGTTHSGALITPGVSDVEIPADTYLSGALTIAGDSDLKSGNIRSGVTLFGVAGTCSGSTVIANIDFYKCASVDTSAKTWTGYKAVLTDGAYSFEETLTTGLSYGTAFTPTVGRVYNSEVNIKIGSLFMPMPMPQSGLVFYAPLNADYVDMISGNSASVTAGSFTEINAKEGLRLTNEYIKWPEYSNLPVGENDISFGCLIFPMEGSTRQTLIGVGNEDSCLPIQYENESILDFGGDLPSDNKWHTVLLTRAGSNNAKVYIDGISAGESRAAFYPASSCVCVGALMSYGYTQTSNAFFSEVFVYNRELTAAEVLEIHNALMEGVTQ